MKNIKSFDLIVDDSDFKMYRIYNSKVEFEGDKIELLKEKFKDNSWFISYYDVRENQKIMGSEFTDLDSRSKYMMYENNHCLNNCPSFLIHTIEDHHLGNHYNDGVFLNPFEALEFLNKYGDNEIQKLKCLKVNHEDGSVTEYFENSNINIYNQIKEMFITLYQSENEQVDINKNHYSPIFNHECNEKYIGILNILSVLMENENDTLFNHQVIFEGVSSIRIRQKMIDHLKLIKEKHNKFVATIDSVIDMMGYSSIDCKNHGSDENSCIEFSVIKLPN
jgi:hypothetical protein